MKTSLPKPIYLRGRCTEEFKKRVDDFCNRQRITESFLVREAVLEYLELCDAKSAPHSQLADDVTRRLQKNLHDLEYEKARAANGSTDTNATARTKLAKVFAKGAGAEKPAKS